MITVSVTSDSSLPELKLANKLISELITLRADRDLGVANVDKRWKPSVEEVKVPSPTFNATELNEAETLGKPVHSTVDVSQSTTAHVDIQDNTSLPAPTSVFGQAAQTAANVVNLVAPPTDNLVRDADGLVWDGRIHSSSKELNKDGTWRKRRGVSDELVAAVEAELRGVSKFEHKSPTTDEGLTLAVEQPAIPLPPVPAAEMTFTELLDGVTKAMVAGQLNQERINAALSVIGLTALPHLLGNPQLIPAFRTALGGIV